MATSTGSNVPGPDSLGMPTPQSEVSEDSLREKATAAQVNDDESLTSRASGVTDAPRSGILAGTIPKADPVDVEGKPDSSSQSAERATDLIAGDATVSKENADPVPEGTKENADASNQNSKTPENVPSDSNSQTKALEVEVPLIPEVRKVNFEHFKNRYSEEDGTYVIDALISGAKFPDEVQHLQKLRKRQPSKKFRSYAPQPPLIRVVENKWIHRVRIQSPGLLLHLGRAVGEDWSVLIPRTFLRPFRVFIYFQPKMKEILRKLEARHNIGVKADGSKETSVSHVRPSNDQTVELDAKDPSAKATQSALDHDASEKVTGPSSKPIRRDTEKTTMSPNDDVNAMHIPNSYKDDEADDDDGSEVGTEESTVTYSMETLKAMRCYVNFVDTEILPLYNTFDGISRTKIRFQDLWLLFRYGELICINQGQSSRPGSGTGGNRGLLPVPLDAWNCLDL